MYFDVGVFVGKDRRREGEEKEKRRQEKKEREESVEISGRSGRSDVCVVVFGRGYKMWYFSSSLWNNNWPNGYRSSSFEESLNSMPSSKNPCCVSAFPLLSPADCQYRFFIFWFNANSESALMPKTLPIGSFLAAGSTRAGIRSTRRPSARCRSRDVAR